MPGATLEAVKKIFFVEDDAYIRKIYERAFRAAGYGPISVTDGEEAIRQLEIMDPPPSAIVLDVQLPKKSGLDVLTWLRSEERYKGVPVAILTNAGLDEVEEKAKEFDIALYMVKIDHEPPEVVEKLGRIIEEAERHHA